MAIMGIGSGLDIRSMVDALVNAERAPKAAQFARLEKATTAKFSGLGQFRSAMSDFQTTLKDLNSSSLFEKRTATSAKPEAFTVSANTKAAAGSYGVQVFQVAQSSKVALRGVEDAGAQLGEGSLKITVGDDELTVPVEEGKSTLAGLRDAINAAGKDKGLTATIVSDPSGEGGSRLVLSSTKSGAGNDIRVEAEGTPELAALSFNPPTSEESKAPESDPLAARTIAQAKDALFAIDGINMSSKTNTVSDAIDGVTLTLKAKQPDDSEPVTLTVAEDRAGVKSSLKKFVDAYNKMFSTIGSLTKVTAVGGDSGQPLTGALVGDASVRSFMTGMRGEMGSPGQGDIKILADLGITTQRDGTLKIDDAKLDKVLADDFDKVSGFLTGDTGLMNRLDEKVKPYTQTGGILESRTKSLQNTLSGVDEQRLQLNRRTAQLETRLLAQFNAMDAMVGQLASTSTYLEGVLSSLPGVVKKDKR